MKTIGKGFLAKALLQDVWSILWMKAALTQQKLQIPERTNNRTLPRWLLDARLSVRNNLQVY